MADLYLHLVFARRLRIAEGLHPLVSEALARRPSLVALGATLASLPANERRGMSFLRRLFSRAGEVARWQRLLAAAPGGPRAELIAAMAAGEAGGLGGMARTALALGLLSYELLENAVGGLTANLQPVERSAVERAQARIWLQATLPREKDLAHEVQPVLALTDGDATRRVLEHANRALTAVHGSGPGEALLQRWVRSLMAEVGVLVEKGGLPPACGMDDQAARGPHYEATAFVEKVQATVNAFVLLADRLGEAFAAGEPDAAALTAALGGARAPEWSQAAVEELRTRWRAWFKEAREAALMRGRNTKPAFSDGEALPEHRLRGATGVMTLADLPPEAADVGAPPLPEPSGANAPPSLPPSLPPTMTQEVSAAQIEAEAGEFASPPHTQEVSTAQIEAEAHEFAAPAHTQEVSAAQIESATLPPTVTQPVAVADIIREQEAARAAEQPSSAVERPPMAAEPASKGAEAQANAAELLPSAAEPASSAVQPHQAAVAPHDNGEAKAAEPAARQGAGPAEPPASPPAAPDTPPGEPVRRE